MEVSSTSGTMTFSDKVTAARVIRGILDQYPFSVGIFRELLQNSDDARASKQIFVLDARSHPETNLIHPHLAKSQGPALLAFNDGIFEDHDWDAIQEISNSSKKADTTKIGKYGLGFRSCYHVTDHPQILSGSTLAIFDPEHRFHKKGGTRIDLSSPPHDISDQLAAFDSCAPGVTSSFLGTVIRLPLRTEEHPEGLGRLVSVDTMKTLFSDFARDELNIVLLCLRHVTSVELREVDDNGVRTLATAEIAFSDPVEAEGDDARLRTVERRVRSCVDGVVREESWLLTHYVADIEEVASVVSARLGVDARDTLEAKKLVPNMSLAFPLDGRHIDGRLFTFLPLPIHTAFPCHIHGLFALTPDRQHLVNAEETGLPEGSDHRRLVVWNHTLFDVVVPRAWAASLQILARLRPNSDVFEFWPGQQPQTVTGDLSYWSQVPAQVLKASNNLNVWPLHSPAASSDVHHVTLDGLLVTARAAQQASDEICDALAIAQIKLTRVPGYVQSMMKELSVARLLSPGAVSEKLMVKPDVLVPLPRQAVNIVLDYLVSDGRARHLIGLPVFFTSLRSDIALREPTAAVRRVLLSTDRQLFADVDHEALVLSKMPSSVSKLLLASGPEHLNVIRLSAAQVISYLHTSTAHPDEGAALRPEWLLSFWSWLAGADTMMQKDIMGDSAFGSLRVFPCEDGLRCASDNVFARPSICSHDLGQALSQLYHVVVPEFPLPAVNVLRKHKKLLAADDMQALLLYGPGSPALPMEAEPAIALRDHIASLIIRDNRRQFKQTVRARLRFLPVFEIYQDEVTVWRGVPADDNIVSISRKADVLPSIRKASFVRELEPAFAPLLDPIHNKGSTLTSTDLAQLWIRHLPEQSVRAQVAFLEDIQSRFNSIPPALVADIRRCAFVRASGSNRALRSPNDLLDPESEVARDLFDQDSDRIPQCHNSDTLALVAALRSLNLLRTNVTVEIMDDCVAFVSNSSHPLPTRHARASALLRLIRQLKFKCTGFQADAALAWLPAEDGKLYDARSCFDSGSNHDKALFDAVAPVVAVEMYTPLRKIIGMDAPIPFDIVRRQLDWTLEDAQGDDKHRRLVVILKELGLRFASGTITEQDIQKLRAATAEREWIPVDSGVAAGVRDCAFKLPFPQVPGIPLFEIPTSLASSRGVSDLMRNLGCLQEPTSESYMAGMRRLPNDEDARTVELAITLLRALAACNISGSDLTLLAVPDVSRRRRPHSSIFFNDIGHRMALLEMPDNAYEAHPLISEDTAAALRLTFASSMALPLDDDDDDMEEKLTTRIANVLRGYTEERSFLELLANAVDASATQFNIILDDRSFLDAQGEYVNPKLAEFQGPALVAHNNSVFTEKDWKGIRKVGLGGKSDNPNTIGRFGLGALSMFHFTEVVMIVSNQHVMFIDPSRQHLTGHKDKAALKILLHRARIIFKDHLKPLNGLFGFDLTMDTYNGTLFRMPLRTGDQASRSELAPKARSSFDMEELVGSKFRRLAELSLFFTPLTDIKGYRRDSLGTLQQTWAFSCMRELTHEAGDLQCRQLSIDQGHERHEWLVARKTAPLPREFQGLSAKHRLPPSLSIGLAASVRHRALGRREDRLAFSTMPLPVVLSSGVPVHVNAPFILADDRQSMRFDDTGLGNLESEFNRWLLREVVPPLYYYLLSHLPRTKNIFDWWPRTPKDPLTTVIVDGFYGKLWSGATLPICSDLREQPVSPQSAIFLPSTETSTVIHLLQNVIRPPGVVLLPSLDIQKRVFKAPVTQLDPDRARTLLLAQSHPLRAAFRDPGPNRMTVAHIASLVNFLESTRREGSDASRLEGLPLLALADGTLTSFDSKNTRYIARTTPGVPEPWPFLPADRFIHPGLSECLRQHPHTMQAMKISPLTAPAMARLVRERIPNGPFRELSDEDTEWARSVWSMARLLPDLAPGEAVDLAQVPLIPTAQGNRHVSLAACMAEGSNIFIEPSAQDTWLAAIVQRLGAICIKVDGFSPELQNRLSSNIFSLETVLRFIQSRGGTALQADFASLPGSQHLDFAIWVERELRVRNLKQLRALKLDAVPIWRSQRGGSSDAPVLRAMTDIEMLPSGLPIAVARSFLHPSRFFVEHTTLLVNLRMKEMTWATLLHNVVFPDRIRDDGAMRDFRSFMELAHSRWPSDLTPPRLPNAERNLVQASLEPLFVRAQPLFAAAFANEPHRYLHPQLDTLRMHLQRFGVHYQITFADFKACAEAIARHSGPGRAEHARIVFEHYAQHLPFNRGPDGERTPWRQLDHIAFIPVDLQRRDGVAWSEEYTEPIEPGMLCAPSQMVRRGLEAVAWTQRYRFLFEPEQHLWMADGVLGIPTVAEVVEHLTVLACRVAEERPGNPSLLMDIQATYQWLTENSAAARPHLLGRSAMPLWLNVEDPSVDTWEWHSANQLVFNGEDEGERRDVRPWLAHFRPLLKAAGAREIERPTRPNVQLTSADATLAAQRRVAERMRTARLLTDVVIIAEDVEFPAHRVVLAMTSEYFADVFGSGFAEGSADASANHPVHMEVLDHPAHAVASCLDFIYAGSFPSSETLETPHLVDIMKLAHYWSMADLFKKMQVVLVEAISIGTYEYLHEESAPLDASVLVAACVEFETKNAAQL